MPKPQDETLSGLNPAQLEAVKATEGPVLIFAGAGSGKTKCLTHRFVQIIEDKKAALSEILLVTFTNKASQEMAKRVLVLLGQETESFERNPNLAMRRYLPWVGTFHSICVRLLRAEAEAFGLKPNFSIFDSDDTTSLIRDILKGLNLDPKQYQPRSIAAVISNAKNELMGPDEYAKFAQGHFQTLAVDVYRKYQRRLQELGALDFDDLIAVTTQSLRDNPTILAKYHSQFKYVMVDEYQDTNNAQYELTKLLIEPKNRNICVVGDDFQSIYSWRGANFQNILNFERDFPRANIFKLEQNYRSTKTILEGAAHIIEKVRRRSQKKLWTANEGGAPITVFEANNAYAEADFIVSEVRSLQSLGYGYSDFAVLYRTNAQSRILEEIFLTEGVPYRLIGAVRFYERREVKDLVSYIRFLQNPDDDYARDRIVNVPARGIGPVTLQKGGPKLEAFISVMERLRNDCVQATPSETLERIIKAVKYLEYIGDGTPEGEARLENVEELVNLASEFENVNDFLEHVALVSDVDSYNAGSDAVTMMTVHSSKGLEFTVVFLAGMEEGLFPHMRALEEDSEMDEERRLCYVGMTRAKKRLYFTLARQRLIHGGLTATLPSRFLREIDEKLLDRV
ncbi:hypothetical protein A3A71_01260 [Candidatus Berkelbacteria bacterium RIFCSPLOWO2_01_FULL_50_28]|uniref:DNA 3'-5' helicase n=1 Tax=Candidatus Berkelbacteria bacterium RIFCSPLOWO2_01_FULL_50_28 TaxID=1797471 RepID=A0A1F5EBM5_9BACT|nr:MAG: hypothetical protein A2807_01830 [Candidatus Berkelbacteria bacterium RIFCSPHIGHO2_01_FULL_50_36]OGD63464.1 MAG: hypothetical protein A3F39_03200 [Candidatus Berkelbacteria bacterium RIFCSPHIGHO2_12_FULL_50_11]OGD64666.1 MAG: hypothetical protein A3A71_01260 [Candidatus Berkelbacteria bacterium RIFCSPLOWO2_01_FULL_50_28]